MIKIMAGVLGLALLATPLCGSAQEKSSATPSPPNALVPQPSEKMLGGYSSYCQLHGTGAQLVGAVIAIGGGHWGGDNAVEFYIKDNNGRIYVDSASWPITYTQAQSMWNLLLIAYTTKTNIVMYCLNQNVNGLWLGEGP